jgi:uncharacterized membrane protein
MEESCSPGSVVLMLVISASRTCKKLSALIVCLFVVAAVICLVHIDAIDGAQTAHQGHNHTPASSATHLTLDLHCLVAILPGVVMLLWFCLDKLYLSILIAKPVVPAFPPFIPPKALARA